MKLKKQFKKKRIFLQSRRKSMDLLFSLRYVKVLNPDVNLVIAVYYHKAQSCQLHHCITGNIHGSTAHSTQRQNSYICLCGSNVLMGTDYLTHYSRLILKSECVFFFF